MTKRKNTVANPMEVLMKIDHKTAMEFWEKQYGKEIKVKDFAGREMAKGAFGQRGSKVGWNLDHILPQSQGGRTTESNLICCNILTNDEKADKFPCFVANGTEFELVKVQNHFEPRIKSKASIVDEDETVNLFDSAQGIGFFKELKGQQNKPKFVGSIQIILKGIQGANIAVLDFLKNIFDSEEFSFSGKGEQFYNKRNYKYETRSNISVLIKDYDLPKQINITNLLDKCVLANTYLGDYFVQFGIVDDYFISFRVDSYSDREKFYFENNKVGFLDPSRFRNSRLKINTMVIQNSRANEKEEFKEQLDSIGWDRDCFYDYNYIYPKLADQLKKGGK